MLDFHGRARVQTAALVLLLLGAGMSPARAEHPGDTAAAQAAVEQSSAAVSALEHAATPVPDAISEARVKRSRLVMAWRRQADAWAAAEPASAEAKSAVTRSEAAMEAYYVPAGGLAPGGAGGAPGGGNDP